MVFQNMTPSGSVDTVQDSVQLQTTGECSANMEGFSILRFHNTAGRNSGHGVVYCLKNFLQELV